jgi:hypothetical protein
MASSNDIKSSQQTYTSFISAAKWGSVAVALIAAMVVYLISR